MDDVRPEMLKALNIMSAAMIDTPLYCPMENRSSVLQIVERTVWPTEEPLIQERQCGFCPGHGVMDQIFSLAELLRGSWKIDSPVHMCFIGQEKVCDHVPLGILCEGAAGI